VLQKCPQTCLQRAQRQGLNLLPPSVIYVSETRSASLAVRQRLSALRETLGQVEALTGEAS